MHYKLFTIFQEEIENINGSQMQLQRTLSTSSVIGQFWPHDTSNLDNFPQSSHQNQNIISMAPRRERIQKRMNITEQREKLLNERQHRLNLREKEMQRQKVIGERQAKLQRQTLQLQRQWKMIERQKLVDQRQRKLQKQRLAQKQIKLIERQRLVDERQIKLIERQRLIDELQRKLQRQRLQAEQYIKPKTPKTRLSTDQETQIRVLYSDGMNNITKLSEKFKVTTKTIRRVLGNLLVAYHKRNVEIQENLPQNLIKEDQNYLNLKFVQQPEELAQHISAELRKFDRKYI